jgi:hypothetical protein
MPPSKKQLKRRLLRHHKIGRLVAAKEIIGRDAKAKKAAADKRKAAAAAAAAAAATGTKPGDGTKPPTKK